MQILKQEITKNKKLGVDFCRKWCIIEVSMYKGLMDVVGDGGAVPPTSTYGGEIDSTHNMK